MLLMNIGNVLTKLRLMKGYTQEQIANELCITRAAYAKWENNKVVLNLLQLKKIAALYHIKLPVLVSIIETGSIVAPDVLYGIINSNQKIV